MEMGYFIHNVLAPPTLLYGSECLTIKTKIKSRIMKVEMKLLRKSLAYNWTDYKTKTEILIQLKVTSVLEKINVYKSNWTNHVNRIPCNRLP